MAMFCASKQRGEGGVSERIQQMRFNSKLTWGLAWAGLAVVLVVPSADYLTGMMILVDNPHTEPGQGGHTAGWNAGEATGRIISRVAPMLGISPNFDPMLDSELVPPELH